MNTTEETLRQESLESVDMIQAPVVSYGLDENDDDDWSNWDDPEDDFNIMENDNDDDILQNLPVQLHPAVSLGVRRVSSCYFSIHSSPPNSVNDLLSLLDENEAAAQHQIDESDGHAAETSDKWSACDILYHDIMMHVFTFLDAQALAAFSETAHRPNFECFYFLQLQLQRALLVMPRNNDQNRSSEQNHLQHDALAAIAGSGCVSRLATTEPTAAQEIVQEYLNSNTTLRTMPLSHSLAYVRHVLRRNGHAAPQSVASAAVFITLVGFSASFVQSMDYSTVLPMLKMGLAGSMLKVGVTAGNAARKATADQQDVRERAEQMARMMLPSQLLEQLQHHANNNEDEGEEEASSDSSQNFPTSIAARMYAAFSASYGPSSSSPSSSPPRRVRDQRTRSSQRRSNHESFNNESAGSSSTESPAVIQEHKMDQEDETRNHGATTDDVLQILAMQHPFTPNPYEHLPKEVAEAAAAEEEKKQEEKLVKELSSSSSQKMPSGCVGAYSRAVRRASEELTRLIKERRKANFASLSVGEQLQVSTTFIDACSSDATLPIVKDLLQKRETIDVDGFYVGSDGTETCALHTAAFHGAREVVEFLVRGINEHNAELDGGLCNVDLCDLNGWTAMHFAAGANSVEVVRVLASHGAKLTVEAMNGYTPFHWAQRLANNEVAQELQRLGADKRFLDAGWQPLFMIASRFFSMIPSH